jgi:hypothetical protein
VGADTNLKRTRRSRTQLVAGALLCVGVLLGACTDAAPRESLLAAQLALRASLGSPLRVGAGTTIRVELANESDSAAVGCTTAPPVCQVLPKPITQSPVHTPLELADHPTCRRRFSLGRGETIVLEIEDLQLPEGFPALGTFSCSVSVSNGRGCHRLYGCDTTRVGGVPREVVIEQEP